MKKNRIMLIAVEMFLGIALSYAVETNSGLAANIAGYANKTNIVWSTATNGARSGLEIISPDKWGKGKSPTAPLSIVCLQNVGASNADYRVRYKAELHGPSGNSVELKSGGLVLERSRRSPTILRAHETSQIGSFSIPEVFKVCTNGTHHLIVSVEAATNRWHGPLTYITLPAMTNAVAIDSILRGGVR